MDALIGKSVVIGITCIAPDGTELDSFQTFGAIEEADETWIGVRRAGATELFGLPPAPELLREPEDEVYTLHPSGERVERPDYLARLTVRCDDADALLTIRGIGLTP